MSWETLRNKNNKEVATDDDKTFASVFNGSKGKAAIEYLEKITNNSLANPNLSSNVLWHLEGQRYLLSVIKQKIKRGQKNG